MANKKPNKKIKELKMPLTFNVGTQKYEPDLRELKKQIKKLKSDKNGQRKNNQGR